MSTLAASYARCRGLNKRHGKTYYWATLLLPRAKRHHVHALYGLCRYADDIVDDLGDTPVSVRTRELARLRRDLSDGLDAGHSDHPVLEAVVATAQQLELPNEYFDRFFRSMEQDLTTDSYETFDDLYGYMDGSAAVIGEMMIPVLAPEPGAREFARNLGIAFQLTNFLRDIGEDLRRERIYIPREDLRRYGVDPTERTVTEGWRALMRFEIERTREFYRSADKGVAMLSGRSARCVSAARVLYSRILEEIEDNDYDVFSRRAGLSTRAKALTVGARLLS
jgi:15-cis-phytoene synthase